MVEGRIMVNFYIKDQGIYTGLYSFSSSEIGSVPTGWTTPSGYSDGQVVSGYQSHQHVFKGTAIAGGAQQTAQRTLTSADKLSGVVEVWMASSDVSADGPFIILLKSDLTQVCNCGLDGSQAVCNGNNMVAVSDATWYHFSMRWRATGGDALASPDDDLLEGKVRCYVNQVEYGDYNLTNDTDVDLIWMYTVSAAGTISGYFDAIGWDWDAGYTIGDNLTQGSDTDITSNISELIIKHGIKRAPTAFMKAYNLTNPIDYDDIIIVKGNLNSMRLHGEPFPGAYNFKDSLDFRDETLGSAPSGTGQGTWTENHGASADSYIIDRYNGHGYVLQLEDYGANSMEIYHTFTSAQASGTIEMWFSTTDVDKNTAPIKLYNGASYSIRTKFDNGDFQVYYSGGWNSIYASVAPGTWYRIRVDFECGSGGYLGLSADTYNAYIYDASGTELGSAEDKPFENNAANLISNYWNTGSGADANWLSFIDAVGYSWDSNYTVGDNANYETTRATTTIFEGRVKVKDNEYEQNIDLESLSLEMAELRPGTQTVKYEPTGYNPNIANQTEEVLSEIIEDKLNSVSATKHDEVYCGSAYNGTNDTDNASPWGFVCGGNVTVAAESVGNHKFSIEFDDNDAGSETAQHHFPDQTSGSIEFWYYCDDPTDQFFVKIYHDTTVVCGVGFDGDEFQYWKSDSTWANCTTIVTGPVASTWYRIRIDIECTSGAYTGLAQYDYSITVYDTAGNIVDGVEDDIDMDSNEAHINSILFSTGAADSGHLVYIDGLGYSWDDRYSVGDNNHILIDNFKVGTTTIDLALTGATSINRQGNFIADLEQFIWTLSPDHKVILSDGNINSQITLAGNDVDQVKGVDMIERYNKVICKGGKSGGNYIEGSATDSDARTTYGPRDRVLYFSDITSTTSLNALAASILAEVGNVPIVITCDYWTSLDLYLLPGEYVTISASTIPFNKNTTFVSAGNWIVMENIYDAMRGKSKLTLMNGLLFTYEGYTEQEMASLINQ
jgi:hypothetical protein